MGTAPTTPTTPSTLQDHYPSRVAHEPRFIERVDPVVWGGPEDGPLSAEQLEQFRRDGCLIVEGVFTPEEITEFNTRLDELSRDPEARAREGTITEPESDEVRSVFDVHRGDPVFRQVAADRRIADIPRQILASEVYIHQSRINFKPGFAGKEFWWHSDFETWHTEDGMPRMRALSASITLTDNYEVNGPLMVVAGSQNTFVSTVGETPDDNYKSSLKRQKVGVPDEESLARLISDGEILTMTGKAGSVVFFDCNVMHASAGNITPFPRSNVFLVYNSVENALEEPFAASKPRPGFLANREVTPIGR
jgi:ectoine hydroxylase